MEGTYLPAYDWGGWGGEEGGGVIACILKRVWGREEGGGVLACI